MSFQLSAEMDGNKVFLVRSSEIEGRLDPHFYKPEFKRLETSILKLNHNKLKYLSLSIQNGSTPTGGKFHETGVPYYRSQDFDLFKIEKNQFVTTEFHKKLKRSAVCIEDVLLAVVGATLGKVGYISSREEEGNINQNVARLRINRDYLIPKYLAIFLYTSLGQKLIIRQATITAQPYLNNEELGKIKIPIPPLEIQSAIVAKMDAAYAAKKEKETEAERLLNSIDDYLLQELGIELPEQEENTVQSRIFTRRFSEISGGRFDPDFHKPYFYNILTNIKETGCKLICLGKISKNIINGYDCREYTDNGLLYLRVANVKKNEFDLRTAKYIPRTDIVKDINLQTGDLLITRKGSFGIAAIVDSSVKNAVISSEIFKISLSENNKIEPIYLSFWLNSKVCQIFFSKIKTGAIMGHLSRDALITVPIILPSIARQQEIADHITRIRNRAKQLRQEAKQGLEQAKQEVEAMILGEDHSGA